MLFMGVLLQEDKDVATQWANLVPCRANEPLIWAGKLILELNNSNSDMPCLGLATTGELLEEIKVRCEMDNTLEYRTVETDEERELRLHQIGYTVRK